MMQPIRFYQIPFSHFCDKVRWALDFYALDYQSINFSPRGTPGLERAPKTLQKLVPIIEDPNEESNFLADSTPILIYLDEHYAKGQSLFPNDKDRIVEYCLKLDSGLGLYSRRLAYLHIINEKPSVLSVLIDGNFQNHSFESLRSSLLGAVGASFVIGRFGVHRTDEEKIFEQTVEVLDQIERDLQGKEYLFDNQFTAADLTLTSLIYPLRIVPPFFQRYSSIFEYADRIRAKHDPRPPKPSIIQKQMNNQRKQPSPPSTFVAPIRSILWHFLYILFYPMQFFFKVDTEENLSPEYPSQNVRERANNDNRALGMKSLPSSIGFFLKYLWHFYFTLPKQMAAFNRKAELTFKT